MYNPCSAAVGNQGPYLPPYNQAPHTNSYSALPMHSGTVPSKNPMPYGGPNAENGPLNNSVGQMPNQSTQVQSASVPPTSQVVNNQLKLEEFETSLEGMKSDNDNLPSQIKNFIETDTSLKETMKIIEAGKENLLKIKKVEELMADLSTRKSEICELIRNLRNDVQDLRRTYELSQDRNAMLLFQLSQVRNAMGLSENQDHPLLTANTPHHSENSFFPPPTDLELDDAWLDDIWLGFDRNIERGCEKELQLSLDDLTLAGVCDAARLPQPDLDDLSSLERYGDTTETEDGSFDSTSTANTSSPLPEDNEIEMDSLPALRGQPLVSIEENEDLRKCFQKDLSNILQDEYVKKKSSEHVKK